MGAAVDIVVRQPLAGAPDLVGYRDAVELDLFARSPFAGAPDLVAYPLSPLDQGAPSYNWTSAWWPARSQAIRPAGAPPPRRRRRFRPYPGANGGRGRWVIIYRP